MDDPIPRGVTLPEIFQKVRAKVYLDAGLVNLPKAKIGINATQPG